MSRTYRKRCWLAV
uniref:Uncharacterized protein n=1 Tax=Anguilla anguilla TaxID=7936 RepID=A0A0E9R117_ANGAN